MMRSHNRPSQDAVLSRFLQQLRKALEKNAHFVMKNRQSPLALRDHFSSVQTILGQYREYRPLLTQPEDDLRAANLIVSLGNWPGQWGAFYTWRDELEFAVNIYKKAGQIRMVAEAAYLLAELCRISSAEGDLRRARKWSTLAVKQAYISKDTLAVGQAVYVQMQILLNSVRSKTIPALYERAIRFINNTSPDSGVRLTSLAFICIPYARFLNRNGKTDKAIQLITEMVDSLPSELGLYLDIHKELYDLRGILYWANGNYPAALRDFDLEYGLLNRRPGVKNSNDSNYEMDTLLISVFANRALVFSALGQLREAVKMTSQAIELSRKANFFSLLMPQIGNLGWYKLCQGEFKQGFEYIEEQLQMAQIAKDEDLEYLAIYNRASIQMRIGQASEAYSNLLNLLNIYKQRKNFSFYAGILIDLSVCNWYLSNTDNAAKHYHQAQSFIAKKQLKAFEVSILRCGALFEASKSARTNLEKALVLAQKSTKKYDEAACLLHLAYLSDDVDVKQKYWREAVLLLKYMEAIAWVENKSADDLVLLPFISA